MIAYAWSHTCNIAQMHPLHKYTSNRNFGLGHLRHFLHLVHCFTEKYMRYCTRQKMFPKWFHSFPFTFCFLLKCCSFTISICCIFVSLCCISFHAIAFAFSCHYSGSCSFFYFQNWQKTDTLSWTWLGRKATLCQIRLSTTSLLCERRTECTNKPRNI